MFGYRTDGKKLKNIGPIYKLVPHIMKRRSDAHVYYAQDIPLTKIDEYIKSKEAEGLNISYMTILYASLIRIIAERPALNRFIMDGRIFARKGIFISLAIKKEMSDELEETIVKLEFTGKENLFEVKDKLEKAIAKNKEVTTKNSTDKLAKLFWLIPNTLMKIIVNTLMFFDRKGILPKSIIQASPMHTSAFLTNVGSLGIDAIYHHIYDFGTTSLFIAMGKKKKSFIFEEDSIKEEKVISMSLVADERICDGFYYANAIKLFNRYMKKPELLEENIEPKLEI